jgi:hypothetical protein
MVFIVGKALVNLRSGQLWEAVCRQCVNRFAILKQANDVVDGRLQIGVEIQMRSRPFRGVGRDRVVPRLPDCCRSHQSTAARARVVAGAPVRSASDLRPMYVCSGSGK